MTNDIQTEASGWSVLVVDDDRVATSVLQKLLEVEGYQVTVARDGLEAWNLLQEHSFPIVLTDRLMPNMNGLELCERIRGRKNPSYTYIILLTIMTSKSEVIEGLNAGADDYLSKPYDYVELIARLNSAQRILFLEQSLKKAHTEVHQLSLTDELTGALNRRAYNKEIEIEFKRALRYKHPISIVLCDLDNLKEVNEKHGSKINDNTLIEFIERVRSVIRINVDEVYRYTGDKFVVLLPETMPEHALTLAERIRYVVATVPFIVDQSNTLGITASFGVCGYTINAVQNEPSAIQLLETAENCLRQAKQQGNNSVFGITLDVKDIA